MIVTNIDNKDLLGLKINDNIMASGVVVGSFVKNTGELTILNENHLYDSLNNTFIDIQGFGTWYVNSIKTDEESVSSVLSLYDITHKFDKAYQDNFEFPATLKAWATWIGEQIGVPLKGDFLNGSVELSERPYIGDNPTWRNAVQIIAKYAGGYAQTNYDNSYSIKWFENVTYEIEDWESFTHEKQKGAINCVVLSSGDTEDNVKFPEDTPTNPCELRIEDDWNYIDRYSIHESIYNQVNGFSYTPISKLNLLYGLSGARAGQRIITKDIEKKEIETYFSKISFDWQGGSFEDINSWNCTINMEELKETNTNHSYASSIQNQILKVERIANKNTGEIYDLIENTTEHEKRLTKNEQNIDSITQKVSSVYDFVRDAIGTDQLIISEAQSGNLLELHITGNFDLNYLSEENELSDENFLLDSYLVVKNSEEEKRVKLPIECLHSVDNVSDELIIEPIYNEETKTYESKAKVIRRITIDESGNKIVSDSEITIDLGILEIPLFKGQNTLYMESFGGLNYIAKYAILNNVIEQYATKSELDASIKQTASEIELSTSQKIENATGTDELIAKINLKPGKIDLEGTVTANENFKILDDGSIEAKDGSFSGNVFMKDGNVIVGGNGLISNLFFRSSGTRCIYSNLGFETQYQNGSNVVERANAYLDIYIPDNFEISKAFLTLQHSTCKWDSSNGEVVGYARKVKIYKAIGSYNIDNAYQTIYINDSQLTEIPNALGVESFTPKNTYDASVETQTGIDISSFLEKGHNLFVARSDDELPTSISSSDIQAKTGMGCLSINIIGFMKVNVEEV